MLNHFISFINSLSIGEAVVFMFILFVGLGGSLLLLAIVVDGIIKLIRDRRTPRRRRSDF